MQATNGPKNNQFQAQKWMWYHWYLRFTADHWKIWVLKAISTLKISRKLLPWTKVYLMLIFFFAFLQWKYVIPEMSGVNIEVVLFCFSFLSVQSSAESSSSPSIFRRFINFVTGRSEASQKPAKRTHTQRLLQRAHSERVTRRRHALLNAAGPSSEEFGGTPGTPAEGNARHKYVWPVGI